MTSTTDKAVLHAISVGNNKVVFVLADPRGAIDDEAAKSLGRFLSEPEDNSLFMHLLSEFSFAATNHLGKVANYPSSGGIAVSPRPYGWFRRFLRGFA